MRTRRVASENDSGFEKAVRSASSDQGRRWARPWRRDSERLLIRARKAGFETAASDPAMAPPPDAAEGAGGGGGGTLLLLLETGRTGGAVVVDMVWFGSGCNGLERGNER